MVKRQQRRRIHYPAELSATLGYFLLVIAWLLVIGTAGVVAIEAIALLAPPPVTPMESPSVFSSISSALNPVTKVDQDLSLTVKIVLGVALFVLVSLTSRFVAVHASKLLRHLITLIRLKVTSAHIFVTKCLLALIAPLLMMIIILGLPEVVKEVGGILVGIVAGFSVVSVIGFSMQHVIVRKANVAVKDIL